MRLARQINVAVDFVGCKLDVTLLEAIASLALRSLPGAVHKVFVLGVSLLDYAGDTKVMSALAGGSLAKMRHALHYLSGPAGDALLFAHVRRGTVLDRYGGDLMVEAFDLRPAIVDALVEHGLLPAPN